MPSRMIVFPVKKSLLQPDFLFWHDDEASRSSWTSWDPTPPRRERRGAKWAALADYWRRSTLNECAAAWP